MITVGSKQFTESWVMGELYAQILTARGFQVVLKSNIGSADIIDRALRSHQIDLYPEYTGVILQTFAMPKRMPVTAHGTYEAAKRFEEGRGLTLLRPTPFQNRNAVAVRTSDARKHGLRTVGDLRRMGRISYAEYPDNITGPLGYDAVVKAYRLSAMKVRPLNIGLQYPALKNGDVDAADVFTTDPQLRRYDFTVLEDDQAIFGFQNVSPVVRRSLVERYGQPAHRAARRGERAAHREGHAGAERGRRHDATEPGEGRRPIPARQRPEVTEEPTIMQSAADIVFDAATKTYAGSAEPAVDALSLTVPAGEICVLLGASGCGKTTALTLVNRLTELTSGDIRIDGRSIRDQDVIELRRSIGYVIQQAGLFPHMTIEENIATVPQVLGWKRSRTADRVRELLELVGLPHKEYADRHPAQLSGGQRQRVGIARALAADPPIMLMDEPFGALDPVTREHMQDEFLRLHEQVRKTTLFVSHDIDEAVRMGDRVAILAKGGRLLQYDSPERILREPADDYVARFVGTDRGLKALTLRSLGELKLDPATGDDEASLRTGDTLRTALSALLAGGAERLPVADESGKTVGSVTVDLIREAA